MNHKKEAEELFNEFGDITFKGLEPVTDTKNVVLLCIKKILEATKRPTSDPMTYELTGKFRYNKDWLKIKEEIEKL